MTLAALTQPRVLLQQKKILVMRQQRQPLAQLLRSPSWCPPGCSSTAGGSAWCASSTRLQRRQQHRRLRLRQHQHLRRQEAGCPPFLEGPR
jgi:hypothetical protein